MWLHIINFLESIHSCRPYDVYEYWNRIHYIRNLHCSWQWHGTTPGPWHRRLHFSRRWCGQSSPVSRESPGKVRYVFKTGLTVFHTFSHILTSCFPISAFNTSLNIISHKDWCSWAFSEGSPRNFWAIIGSFHVEWDYGPHISSSDLVEFLLVCCRLSKINKSKSWASYSK